VSTPSPGRYQQADPESFWEEHYRSRRVRAGRANPLLVEAARALRPGAALDLGCGAGGDTIWLAEHGWQVTAVDIAKTAVERVRAHAGELALDPEKWPVLRADMPRRRATGPGGRTAIVTDNVLLIQRADA